MTSLAFILGISPLVFASGADARSRQTLGWTVLGSTLAATGSSILIVPVLYVIITRFAYGKEKLAELERNHKPDEEYGGPKPDDTPHKSDAPRSMPAPA